MTLALSFVHILSVHKIMRENNSLKYKWRDYGSVNKLWKIVECSKISLYPAHLQMSVYPPTGDVILEKGIH